MTERAGGEGGEGDAVRTGDGADGRVVAAATGGASSTASRRVQRAEENLEHWRAQAAQVERERRGMVWVLRIGLPLAGLVALLVHGWIGVGVGAMSLLTYVMGIYMTTVRRGEFAHHVRDAEAELAAARRLS
ncbi:MAG: hypothetical protein ACOYMM_06670 [Phycisphaerales bacterium]|jgi:hypothetical protein